MRTWLLFLLISLTGLAKISAQVQDIELNILFPAKVVSASQVKEVTGWLIPEKHYIRQYDTLKIKGAGKEPILLSGIYFSSNGSLQRMVKYDPYGSISEIIMFNSQGLPEQKIVYRDNSMSGKRGYVSNFKYDKSRKRLLSFTTVNFDSSSVTANKNACSYFSQTKLIWKDKRMSSAVTTFCDNKDSVVGVFQYSDQQLTGFSVKDSPHSYISFKYDSRGMLVESSGADEPIYQLQRKRKYEYDKRSLLVLEHWENEGVVKYEYSYR
jgi:hypothetical protein